MYKYKNPYILDFRNIQYYLEMHQIIKETFDFPDYYGANWSAFWDCLTDMVGRPIRIQILGLDVLEKKFSGSSEKMLEILERLRHWCDDKYINDISIEIM